MHMQPTSENSRQKGLRAEDLAAEFLVTKGYRILCRNWTAGKLEVDLIAADKTHLAFIEVKSRSSRAFGAPLEAVNSAKRRSIVRAADIYLSRSDNSLEPRFDIISIIMETPPEIEHIEAAFFPHA